MSEGRSVVADESTRVFSASEAGTSSQPPVNAGPQPAGGARLGTEVEAVIGRRLKALYDDVVNAPVPDRFMQLLAQLEQAQGAPATGAADTAAGPATDPTETDR